jgi:thioredoxin 1
MQNFSLIIIGLVGIVMITQFLTRFKSRSKKGKNAHRISGSLGKSIQHGEKVIAYFYSPTCSTCRTQEKYLPKIQETFTKIFRINAVKERELASAFGVMGTATTVIIDKGIIKAYFVGITPPLKILKSL